MIHVRRDVHRDERGLAIVWTALLLVVMLGMAAFAVDVANWYVHAQKAQRAADAAALGGVVFMPDGFTTAQSVAQTSAAGNGFATAQVQVQTVTGRSNQLKVTVTQQVQNAFGGIWGSRFTQVRRSAIAEYQGPVPMGSPVNGLGNEPILQCRSQDFANQADYQACVARQESPWVTAAGQGQFWLHISSPARAKSTGDAFQSFACSVVNPDCPTTNNNLDYQPDGYFYTVRSPQAGQRMLIQVFDPAAIRVGDNCTHSNLNGAANIAPSLVPDARYRYASGTNSPFCTGDENTGGVTSYIVRAPDSTPWTNLDNPVVCRAQFSGFDGPLEPRLNPSKPEYNLLLPDGRRVADTFRRWVDLCAIPSAEAGDYLVQIRTNVDLSPTPESAPVVTSLGNAGNRFSLRAAYSSGSGPTATGTAGGISVFAAGRLGIYANATGANTSFYLARVPPDGAGRNLTLSFYDTGDASTAGRITVLPPNGSLAGRCTYTGPSGPNAALAQDCILDPVTVSTMNGRWMRLTIRIPDSYTCTVSNPNDCWFRLQFTYPAGTSVQDTTSWQANMEGDPVRLVA